MDHNAHNLEQKQVWDAFHSGDPIRMPCQVGCNARIMLLNKDLNPEGVTFKDYTENADIMFDWQLRFNYHKRMNIRGDHEMGIPDSHWTVSVDLQNFYDAVWFGAPLYYCEGNVPDTHPILNDDNKNMLFDKGIPDAFSGWAGIARDRYEYFKEKGRNFEFHGRPVRAGCPYLGSDGPFSVACNLRGATELCLDIYEDPDYFLKLMDYITEAFIYRTKAWRRYVGHPEKQPNFSFADDSIALISTDMYKELVMPFHKRLIAELSTGERPNYMHLCGDATRHFKTLRDELRVYTFDTGFPVNHGALAEELGPEVNIYGGVKADILQLGTVEDVISETRRILDDVKYKTKRFVMKEANNLAPNTPIANTDAMYDTVRKYGVYR